MPYIVYVLLLEYSELMQNANIYYIAKKIQECKGISFENIFTSSSETYNKQAKDFEENSSFKKHMKQINFAKKKLKNAGLSKEALQQKTDIINNYIKCVQHACSMFHSVNSISDITLEVLNAMEANLKNNPKDASEELQKIINLADHSTATLTRTDFYEKISDDYQSLFISVENRKIIFKHPSKANIQTVELCNFLNKTFAKFMSMFPKKSKDLPEWEAIMKAILSLAKNKSPFSFQLAEKS